MQCTLKPATQGTWRLALPASGRSLARERFSSAARPSRKTAARSGACRFGEWSSAPAASRLRAPIHSIGVAVIAMASVACRDLNPADAFGGFRFHPMTGIYIHPSERCSNRRPDSIRSRTGAVAISTRWPQFSSRAAGEFLVDRMIPTSRTLRCARLPAASGHQPGFPVDGRGRFRKSDSGFRPDPAAPPVWENTPRSRNSKPRVPMGSGEQQQGGEADPSAHGSLSRGKAIIRACGIEDGGIMKGCRATMKRNARCRPPWRCRSCPSARRYSRRFLRLVALSFNHQDPASGQRCRRSASAVAALPGWPATHQNDVEGAALSGLAFDRGGRP